MLSPVLSIGPRVRHYRGDELDSFGRAVVESGRGVGSAKRRKGREGRIHRFLKEALKGVDCVTST